MRAKAVGVVAYALAHLLAQVERNMQNTFLLNHGKLLAQAGELGTLWRVQEGVLRLDQVGCEDTILVQLAFPGDLVGVESLCSQPYAYTVTALTTCVLAEQNVSYDLARFSAVTQGFMQQQERMKDMMRLRTGTVKERLAYFLKLLAHNADGATRELERRDLPTHKEVAAIIGTATETVCRELNAFLPAKTYKRTTKSVAWSESTLAMS